MKQIISSVVLVLLFCSSPLLAQKNQKLNKTNNEGHRTKFNINNISTYINNNGDSDLSPSGDSGFEFPKGSGKSIVYESGIVWGGKIKESIFVGGNTYNQGIAGGRVLENGTPQNPVDPSVRAYRVRPDYKTSDLVAEINDENLTQNEIRTQYELDWIGWPAEFGAPFEDIDQNGIYDPTIDIPGIKDADQTIWYVANDLDIETCRSLYGSDPMGIELQVTIWGYNIPGHLENVMFKKYKIINKSENDFVDMYVTQWHDMDIGLPSDDFQGIDTLLNMNFGYNGVEYDGDYGLTTPAIGFQFLQGPIVNSPGVTAYSNDKEIEDYKNLGLTSFIFYLCGGPAPWIDPDLGNYRDGTLEMYQHMQGLFTDGSPIEIPEQYGSGITKLPLSGNPITGEGWLDGYLRPPCDIRGVASSGPFEIATGEYQEIVIAQTAAQGKDNLNSVALLKYYASLLQKDYPNILPQEQVPNIVTFTPTINKNEFAEYDLIKLEIQRADSIENFDKDGYKFQGYKFYQLKNKSRNLNTGNTVFTFDKKDNIKDIYGETYDPTTGYLTTNIIYNATNSGIPETIRIEKDYINNSPLIKGKEYYFGLSAYFYNSPQNKAIETSVNTLEIVFQEELSGPEYLDVVKYEHTNGTADITIVTEIVNPNELTGDTYEVRFGEQHYYLNNEGDWIKTNFPDSVGKTLNKPNDISGSTLIPLPSLYAPNNTMDLQFIVDIQSTDYNTADGIKITFPEGIIINSANLFSEYGYELAIINVIQGQSVVWGSSDTTGGGHFQGGEKLVVNVNHLDPSFTIDFEMYDDGWSNIWGLGGDINNAVGTIQLTGAICYKFKSEKYWELYNNTKEKYALEYQTIFSRLDVYDYETYGYNYEPVVDGIRIKLTGTFEEPINFSSIKLNDESLSTLSRYSQNDNIDIQNYTIFGGANSYAADNFGVGTYDLDQLQQDYELRFTGVYDDGTNIGGNTVYQVIEGGSYATCFRMSSVGELANHPLNPNKGTAKPFLVRIPFEVWNIEDPDNPYQVNITYRDRARYGDENPFYAWNPTDRMFPIIVNSPYNPNQIIQVDGGPDEFNALATWVLVMYATNYHLDDTVKINYTNPLKFTDVYTFTTPEAPTDKISPNQYEVFQNYPNPFNPNTKIRYYIPEDGLVNISVFNILGQKVAEVENKTLKAGKYETEFNGSSFASGVYIYRIEANNFIQTKKMLLLK